MKRHTIRAAALFLTLLASVLCLGACGNGSAINEEIDSRPIPEGMTFDDLCGILSIYDHNVTLPCTMDDIIALDERISRDPQAELQCIFSTNRQASLMYLPSSGVNGSSYFNTVMLMARDELYKTDLFAVNGIKFGSDTSAVKELLGEPVSMTSSGVFGGSNFHYAYIEGDAALRLWFIGNADGKLCLAQLMYTKWTKV
ncbi:MAG: hypothetical protein J6O50_04615 [Ruminiclostridium sp.]|nr:hypothetical protein [Ruminiclostridium sp.]